MSGIHLNGVEGAKPIVNPEKTMSAGQSNETIEITFKKAEGSQNPVEVEVSAETKEAAAATAKSHAVSHAHSVASMREMKAASNAQEFFKSFIGGDPKHMHDTEYCRESLATDYVERAVAKEYADELGMNQRSEFKNAISDVFEPNISAEQKEAGDKLIDKLYGSLDYNVSNREKEKLLDFFNSTKLPEEKKAEIKEFITNITKDTDSEFVEHTLRGYLADNGTTKPSDEQKQQLLALLDEIPVYENPTTRSAVFRPEHKAVIKRLIENGEVSTKDLQIIRNSYLPGMNTSAFRSDLEGRAEARIAQFFNVELPAYQRLND